MSRARWSSPPSLAKLRASTTNLTKELDNLKASVGHLPTPVPPAKVELTDLHRIEACRELEAFWLKGGYIDLGEALTAYRAAARGRLR